MKLVIGLLALFLSEALPQTETKAISIFVTGEPKDVYEFKTGFSGWQRKHPACFAITDDSSKATYILKVRWHLAKSFIKPTTTENMVLTDKNEKLVWEKANASAKWTAKAINQPYFDLQKAVCGNVN